jgi:solute carrier family 25 (mitochondrial carnitine/acylcarnitine transporter), member 20/29
LKIKDALLHILKTEGWKGLYVGYTPSVIRAFPVNAATFLGYEFVLQFLNK